MLKNYNGKERHIVLITDDNYVMPTRVVITSLINNIPQNNEYEYFVHICTFQISEKNKSLLEHCSSGNVSVDVMIIPESQYAEKFARINQKSHVTPAALIKFDLCMLFPSVNELLYIDSDIIINKSLDSLFNYDISDYYLAASFEFWQYMMEVYKYKKHNVEKPNFYFNSGIMLFNLKKIREEHIPEKLWETKYNSYNLPNAKKQCMDQDALNAVLAKKMYTSSNQI
jgi:lipopolysaccharide biosynthesis glycosyltransferase